jgi:MYXO-CTERM domain-containing protein
VQGIAQTSGPVLGSVMIEVAPHSIAWALIGLLGIAAALGFRRRRR